MSADQLMAAPIVLIADDYVDACEMYAEYLRFHGFEVLVAFDGLEAVEAARRRRPDIVLLDIRMPVMSGTEAMQILKTDPEMSNVPIIALTAHARHEERDAALLAGFDAFIPKPLSPEQLVARLTAILGSRPGSEERLREDS